MPTAAKSSGWWSADSTVRAASWAAPLPAQSIPALMNHDHRLLHADRKHHLDRQTARRDADGGEGFLALSYDSQDGAAPPSVLDATTCSRLIAAASTSCAGSAKLQMNSAADLEDAGEALWLTYSRSHLQPGAPERKALAKQAEAVAADLTM